MIAVLVTILAALSVGVALFLRHKPIIALLCLVAGILPWLLGAPQAALITSTLALSMLLAQPLFVVLGFVTLLCFQFLSDVPPTDFGIFPEKIFELTDKNVLLAIPFFVLSGAIMTHGGIAKRLIDFAKALTTWLPGGMAIAAIGGCVLFAAISGSSPVTVIAIGGMMYPALIRAGFDKHTSIGLLTSAGSLGIVIPPSIPMIIYAIVVSGRQVVDIGDLFMAGLGPGLLIGALLACYVIGVALKNSKQRRLEIVKMLKGFAIIITPIAIGEALALGGGWLWGHLLGPVVLLILAIVIARKEFIEGVWALMLPVIILGGIYAGFFTPTEAAAVAVIYALLVAIFIYRELQWRQLPELIAESTLLMGSLIVIMVVAFVFNDYLVEEQIPERAVTWIQSMDLSRITFLLALNLFLLVVGCLMDIISAILIIAPLIAPIAMSPGIDIDPIHLGMIFIVNLELGYLTPPLGLNLFVSSSLFRQPLGTVIRSVMPYAAIMLIGIAWITYQPMIALGPGQIIAKLRNQHKPQQEKISQSSGKVLSIEELMRQAQPQQPATAESEE